MILLDKAGRTVLVRFVITAIPVYVLLAMRLPKWAVKAIDKVRRGFLWAGGEQANGGNCLVARKKVGDLWSWGV